MPLTARCIYILLTSALARVTVSGALGKVDLGGDKIKKKLQAT